MPRNLAERTEVSDRVLAADQHRHHNDHRLLRFFLQGHLDNNANVDLDVILKIVLKILDAVNSFLLIIKKGTQEGWMACILCYF